MQIEIYLTISTNTTHPKIYFKDKLIHLENINHQNIMIQDSIKINSFFEFDVENIQNNSSYILIKKILINGVEVNKYQNTSFIMQGNKWIQEKTLTSVHRIDYNGKFILHITDQFIEPIRSQYWHVSNYLNDYIFNYNFTNDVFELKYKPRNHDKILDRTICVLGDSFTYGASIKNEDTWPFILEERLKQKVNNLAVAGAGVDLIYNNFNKLLKNYCFNKIIIVLPNLERRVIKCHLDDGRIYRVPNAFSPADDNNTWRYANHKKVKKKRQHVENQIVKDLDCVYSKKVLKKIIDIAEKNKVNLFMSSRSRETYAYIQSLGSNYFKLLPFYDLEWFKERANNYHPTFTHNNRFVDLIADQL